MLKQVFRGTTTGSKADSLQKHAYSNIQKISPPKVKKKKIQIKILIFFHISAKNIDCGYSLELPHWVLIRTASVRQF